MFTVTLRTMDTQEVQSYMKKIYPSLEYNVFAANRIPINVKLPFCLISNLDPDSKPGSHWIAIYINKHGVGEYFDSYGRKPSGNHLSFLKTNCKKWFYNCKVLQHYLTSVCGEYCLVYVLFKISNVPMYNFFELFSDNTLCNDIIIHNFFKSVFLN